MDRRRLASGRETELGTAQVLRASSSVRNAVPRYLCCASNSRPFEQTPQSGGILFLREFSGEFHIKSLFCNILHVNHLYGIFCGELFPVAICFQYLASKKARGYSRTNSLTVRQNGDFPGAAPFPGLVRYIRNSLCGIGALVYGEWFARTQERVWPPDRIFEKDGPFEYSGRERSPVRERLFAASGFGSPSRRGELLAAQHVVEIQRPQLHDTRLFLSSTDTMHRDVQPPVWDWEARCGTLQAILIWNKEKRLWQFKGIGTRSRKPTGGRPPDCDYSERNPVGGESWQRWHSCLC